jgi:hypothetical protein
MCEVQQMRHNVNHVQLLIQLQPKREMKTHDKPPN